MSTGTPTLSTLRKCVDNIDASALSWILAVLSLSNITDAVEITCVGYIMSDIKDMSASQKEMLSSGVFVGMLFGGLTISLIAERIGRRNALLCALLLNSASGLLSSISPSVQFLIGCRSCCGFAIGSCVPLIFSMGSELSPTVTRGQCLSIISGCWVLGLMYTAIAAWIVLGDDFGGHRILPIGSWRMLVLICSVPSLTALVLGLYRLPESPIYLYEHGQGAALERTLRAICTNYILYVDSDDYSTIEEDIDTTVVIELSNQQSKENEVRSVYSPISLGETSIRGYHQTSQQEEEETNQWSSNSAISINPLIGSKNTSSPFVWNVFLLSMVWFILSFGTYGFTVWINLLYGDMHLMNPFATSFLFACGNVPGNVFSYWYVESIGRRGILLWGMVLSAIAAMVFAFGVVIHDKIVIVVSSLIYSATSVSGWNSLGCMSVETFPAAIRPTTMGILSACGRVGAITAQVVFGALESNLAILLFVVSCCMILGSVISLWIPDYTGVAIDDQQTPHHATNEPTTP